MNSLRNDFITKLPEKVRSGLDPESPSPLDLDLSRVSGLTKGISLSLSLCVWFIRKEQKENGVYMYMHVCVYACMYICRTNFN